MRGPTEVYTFYIAFTILPRTQPRVNMFQASMRALSFILICVLAATASHSENLRRVPAPHDAKLFFPDLKDGAKIPARSIIRFGASGIEIAPAGDERPNTGHFHLLIDTGLPPLDQEIPSDFNHLHFGKGQTEVELSLTPGEHTLQLLLGDYRHVPHDPPVFSEVLHVQVDAATVERTRTPAPGDAKVFFIGLEDGARLPVRSVIKFGISGMDSGSRGNHNTE